MSSLQSVKVSECVESATNPRGNKFEGKEFDELVASVQEKGVLMPILVRAQKGKFEVVAGNRRFRAAKQVGLKEIPAHIAEMTDIEAREAQIVENLQRADVHPLEEGAAYRDLIEQSGYDVEAVGAKVGKSESYVRNRLVLTNLIKKAQQSFREGIITAGHAALVARLDEEAAKRGTRVSRQRD
jgi:ParB family chromosome partitioning protein